MKKLLLALLTFFLFINANALEVSSEKVLLYNLNDNEVIFEKNKDVVGSIASLTKIMTTIVAIENIDDFNKEIIMTRDMFKGLYESNAFQIGLRVGEVVNYDDLLYGTLIASGADAVRGLTYTIAGSEEEFVKLMNDKAKELNLKHTVFKNPIGLDEEGQASSISDVAIMLNYALKNEKFKTIFETEKYTLSNNRITISSSLVGYAKNYGYDVSFIKGGKTGFTYAAGKCLASLAYDKENDINYMLITTNASIEKDEAYHVLDAVNIYKYYFDNYKYQTLVEENDLLKKITVKDSKIKELKITAKEKVTKYLKNDYDKTKINITYKGKEEINFKDKKGDKIGEIIVKYDDKLVKNIDVLLEEDIKFSLYNHIIQSKIRIGAVISIILLSIILIIKKMR